MIFVVRDVDLVASEVYVCDATMMKVRVVFVELSVTSLRIRNVGGLWLELSSHRKIK